MVLLHIVALVATTPTKAQLCHTSILVRAFQVATWQRELVVGLQMLLLQRLQGIPIQHNIHQSCTMGVETGRSL